MSSKAQILKTVRQKKVATNPLPDLAVNWIQYQNAMQQFIEMVAAVGGEAHLVDNIEQAASQLNAISTFSHAKTIFSQIPELSASTTDIQDVDDPHDLEHVDYSIFRGVFGVAENGAIWMTDADLKHRVLMFIAQHLVIVISTNEIVHNMHEAYERLPFDSNEFGLFMSGPSKTADIEQSLVIGAHGARSLHVFLISA